MKGKYYFKLNINIYHAILQHMVSGNIVYIFDI